MFTVSDDDDDEEEGERDGEEYEGKGEEEEEFEKEDKSFVHEECGSCDGLMSWALTSAALSSLLGAITVEQSFVVPLRFSCSCSRCSRRGITGREGEEGFVPLGDRSRVIDFCIRNKNQKRIGSD